MKNLNLITLLFVVSILNYSCSSDSSPVASNNPDDGPSAYFSVETDQAVFFNTSNVVAKREGNNLIIVAQKSGGEMIRIECAAVETMQSDGVQIAYVNANGIHYYNIDGYVTNLHGTVTIHELNEQNIVVGNFEFTGRNFSHGLPPIYFTNGAFSNIPLVDSVPDLGWPEDTEGYAFAKVNGVDRLFDYTEVEIENGIKTAKSTIMPIMHYLKIELPQSVTPGVYQLVPNGDIVAKYGFYGVEATAQSGTIEITANENSSLKATIDFIAVDENGNIYNISQGQINIP